MNQKSRVTLSETDDKLEELPQNQVSESLPSCIVRRGVFHTMNVESCQIRPGVFHIFSTFFPHLQCLPTGYHDQPEIFRSPEVIMTSGDLGVAPVTSIDGTSIGDGQATT